MPNFSPALIWLILGIVLVILELLSGSLFFIFIGTAALITALVAALGVENIAIQIIIFCAASLVLILVLRRTAKRLFYGHYDLPPDFMGEKVSVIKDIPVGGEGYVKYRGSQWIAYSDDAENIPSGATVEVVGHDGIKLKVKQIKSA